MAFTLEGLPPKVRAFVVEKTADLERDPLKRVLYRAHVTHPDESWEGFATIAYSHLGTRVMHYPTEDMLIDITNQIGWGNGFSTLQRPPEFSTFHKRRAAQDSMYDPDVQFHSYLGHGWACITQEALDAIEQITSLPTHSFFLSEPVQCPPPPDDNHKWFFVDFPRHDIVDYENTSAYWRRVGNGPTFRYQPMDVLQYAFKSITPAIPIVRCKHQGLIFCRKGLLEILESRGMVCIRAL